MGIGHHVLKGHRKSIQSFVCWKILFEEIITICPGSIIGITYRAATGLFHKIVASSRKALTGYLLPKFLQCGYKTNSVFYQILPKISHHNLIRRQPINSIQFVIRKPSSCFVFQQSQLASFYFADKALHGEMKGRIVVFHGTKEVIDANLCRKFLANLPPQRILGRFPSSRASY